MIILDTNIISEMMAEKPNQQVLQWIDKQDPNKVYITSVSMAEVWFGLYLLPDGKRKTRLTNQFNLMIKDIYTDKQLAFLPKHSESYAQLRANRQKMGMPMSNADCQIASIAYYHQATLATRNIKDFKHCKINLANPFN